VAVLKRDKTSVRICGDFSVTINPVSKLDRYPIPKVEDLFSRLSGGKYFTKLDLSDAYQQVPLEEESKKYVVVNTRRGLFRYTRLPFGVSSAPGIFQRVIEGLLQGIESVVVYLDDILITGATEEEHLRTLDEVLSRLDKAGLRVKRSKCEFMRESVTYLGHRIDADGLHPLPDRVRAIKEAPKPTSVTTLKAYLGMLTYYSKFLPKLSTLLYPLYRLLRKGVPWRWGTKQARAFKASKKLLTSDKCLTHFDSSLKLTLACDASEYGLGAVISHKMPDGSEKPIGYASRTLSPSERNYSQLEKEGLSCIFGIKKFHDYLFGRSFELVTDHKPLLGLLKEGRAVSPQASARIKRWSLFLSSYEYTLSFRKTGAHANADALSRLPLPEEPAKTTVEPELVLLAEHLDESPVTAADIRTWTSRDPKLSRVLQYVQCGWPNNGDSELEPYSSRRLELSSYEGCLMWGTRVVIPPPGRVAVLQELHEGHPGISKMKALARMYVWWPGMNADIEKSVRRCGECQQVQSSPPLAPLNPWKWPSRPWARLHLDFAGPFQGKTILVLIDAHSKWIEAICTPSTSSSAVIDELRTLFAKFGLPETIVTDNGTGFTSQEFKTYLKNNGVKHVTSSPYHPASNGLAERAVQIVKRGLKKVTSGKMSARIAEVLFTYRVSPHTTTGVSPAELLLGRQLRTRLDLIRPNTAKRVEERQDAQKAKHDTRAKARAFKPGDKVYVKNFGPGQSWLTGEIVKSTGPVSYHVQLTNGRTRRCHQDQLRPREGDEEVTEEVLDESPDDNEFILTPTPTNFEATDDQPQGVEPPTPTPTVSQEESPPPAMQGRYPHRNRKKRVHFEPSNT
jgi:transposase InsO family protein